MDKRILYGGGAALAAYFWWASRSSSSTPATTVTRTPSTTPNGVGFDIGAALGALGSMVNKPATTAPDATVFNGVTGPMLVTGPAPATTSGFVIGGSAPGSGPAAPPPPGSGYFASILGPRDTEINDPTAVGRFDSINAYINTLDWSADNKAASSAALAQAANKYGVSQREIAIASGYKDSDVAALLSGQNVPRV